MHVLWKVFPQDHERSDLMGLLGPNWSFICNLLKYYFTQIIFPVLSMLEISPVWEIEKPLKLIVLIIH